MWYWKVTFASYSLRKKSGQRRKVERGGEKRKRLPANSMILENAPWHCTVRFICKLTARQDRSLYNEQITGFVNFFFHFFFNYCQVKFGTLCGLSHLKPCKNVAKKWFVLNNSLHRLWVLQSGCSPARVEKFSAIHAAKFLMNKNNLFNSKSWQIVCPWRL